MTIEMKPSDAKTKIHRQFIEDCLSAGLRVEHYRGRLYYDGPAVEVAYLDEVEAATTLPLVWDDRGEDWIVYPADEGEPEGHVLPRYVALLAAHLTWKHANKGQ